MSDRGADVTRSSRRRIDGVLLLDKPPGISSNAALQRARRALDAAKAGHTGTLDPLASGLLPVCFGEATKFARFLLDADKRYTATIHFGVTTTTQDAEGDVVARSPVRFGGAEIETALGAFRGAIMQVPPAHSALKHRGRRHCDYARAGVEVERKAREVVVSILRLVDWDPPRAVVDVACSKGTYVRSLAADLGTALGCGAHLAGLRRTSSGGYSVDDAVTLAGLEAMPEAARLASLLPVDALLTALPRVALAPAAAQAFRQGQSVAERCEKSGPVAVYDAGGTLIGVAESRGPSLAPVRLTSTGVRE